MWHAGGEYWARWYPAIRDALVARQRDDGSWMDSICPEYGTAMACDHPANAQQLSADLSALKCSDKTAGDCPNFGSPGEQNGTVPLSDAVLSDLISPAGIVLGLLRVPTACAGLRWLLAAAVFSGAR